MLERACLAVSRFSGLTAADAGNYRISGLALQYGVQLGQASEKVTQEKASPEAAELPRSGEPHTALLRLERTVFTIGGLPVECRVGLCVMRGMA